MEKIRPVIVATLALLFYTLTDILIWQRIFEANNLTQYANTYKTGWLVTLVGYGVLGSILMWGAWKDILYFLISLFVLAFSGLQDMLHYVLGGEPMPETLPWLDANPMIFEVSRTGALSSVLFWIAALVIFHVVLYRWRINHYSKVNSQTSTD